MKGLNTVKILHARAVQCCKVSNKVSILLSLCLACSFVKVLGQKQFTRDSILVKYEYMQVHTVGKDGMIVIKKTNTPKPTIIFIGGSYTPPLFINGGFIGTPFNPYPYLDNYNFVVVSRPGVPIFDDSVNNKYLNQSMHGGAFVNSKGQIPEELKKNNNLPYYEKAHRNVVDWVNKQPWAKKDDIILMGHSQGSHVALAAAFENNAVKKVVIMSPGSLYNRFHQFIREVRIEEMLGQIDAAIAQQKIDSIYQDHRAMVNNKENNDSLFDSFSFYSYYSFVYPARSEMLLKLKQKILLVYGTGSIQDIDCDYLQLNLDEHHKTNVTIKPYRGYDHNYFENIFNDNGSFKEQKFHWYEVMDDVVKWISNN